MHFPLSRHWKSHEAINKRAKENEKSLQLILLPYVCVTPAKALSRVPSCEERDIDSESGKSESSKSSCSSKFIINRIIITLGPVDVQQFWWFPIKVAGHEVQMYHSLLLHGLCLCWSIMLTVCLQCNTWQNFSAEKFWTFFKLIFTLSSIQWF